MLDSLIASSVSKLPEPALRGYAQVGGDFVMGESGRSEYGNVPPGHDGAYVTVLPAGDGGVTVGTDDAGFGRLFLYQRGHRWALGTSLMELADYVSSQVWPLSVDPVQLKGFLLTPKGMLGSQLLSLDTIFREIRLLAPVEQATVLPGLRPCVVVSHREGPTPGTYEEALQDALNEMVGRLRSVLHAGVPVASDITGGRDSRTVLAALRLANDSGRSVGDVVRFRSSPKMTDDWAVATSLDAKYGLSLNRSPAESYRVDPAHSYRVWRTHDLGTYAPLYQFRSYTPEVTLSGAAGGVHRSVYQDATLRDRLLRMQSEHLSAGELGELASRMEQTLDHVGGHHDRRLEHFRQFRNRFHGGRNPLRTHNVAPLASRKLKLASGMMSDDHLDRAQFYADIMLNLAPDLAAEPYDVASKGWGDQHHQELTQVTVDPTRYEGAVYGAMDHPPRVERAPKRPLEPFVDAFSEAAPAAVDSGLLPASYVKAAQKALDETDGVRFSHATKGRGVSMVILVGQAIRLSSDG